jgi:predicted methyltransferase
MTQMKLSPAGATVACVLMLCSILNLAAAEDRDITNPSQYLRAAVASEDRPEADRARDQHRKPARVLAFFGVAPGQKVAELMTGRGYYIDIISRVVGDSGVAYAHNSPFVLERFAEGPLTERLANPRLSNVVRLDRELEDPGLPRNLDAVLIVLFYHDTFWQGVDREKMNTAVYEALKPGGVYGVVDHHAPAGSGDRDVKTLHRVDAELVKKEILAAGFEFDGESEMLHHPEDTRDYNVFRDVETKRDRTDRFIFRFRKPAAVPAGLPVAP